MMFSGLGSALAQARANATEARIREAMADRQELNALQSEYRNWVRQPKFRKIGGRWFAEVEYPPSVPRVPRETPTA